MTMGRYGMRGTPTSILIGRDGVIRHHGFGQEDDMALGALIASALCDAKPDPDGGRAVEEAAAGDACQVG